MEIPLIYKITWIIFPVLFILAIILSFRRAKRFKKGLTDFARTIGFTTPESDVYSHLPGKFSHLGTSLLMEGKKGGQNIKIVSVVDGGNATVSRVRFGGGMSDSGSNLINSYAYITDARIPQFSISKKYRFANTINNNITFDGHEKFFSKFIIQGNEEDREFLENIINFYEQRDYDFGIYSSGNFLVAMVYDYKRLTQTMFLDKVIDLFVEVKATKFTSSVTAAIETSKKYEANAKLTRKWIKIAVIVIFSFVGLFLLGIFFFIFIAAGLFGFIS